MKTEKIDDVDCIAIRLQEKEEQKTTQDKKKS